MCENKIFIKGLIVGNNIPPPPPGPITFHPPLRESFEVFPFIFLPGKIVSGKQFSFNGSGFLKDRFSKDAMADPEQMTAWFLLIPGRDYYCCSLK